jgi:hypothetical protein
MAVTKKRNITRVGAVQSFGQPGFLRVKAPLARLGSKFRGLLGPARQALPHAPHLKEQRKPVSGLVAPAFGGQAEIILRCVEVMPFQGLMAKPIIHFIPVKLRCEVLYAPRLRRVLSKPPDSLRQAFLRLLGIERGFPKDFTSGAQRLVEIHSTCPSVW